MKDWKQNLKNWLQRLSNWVQISSLVMALWKNKLAQTDASATSYINTILDSQIDCDAVSRVSTNAWNCFS